MTATDTTAGRAEAIRLARVLGADPSDLPGLAMLTPVERAAVRHVVLDSLLAQHRTLLARLADSSALVPISLTVKIAQNVFGPRLAALVSGFLSPARAAGLIGKVPRDLLVDQTPHLDERILPPLAAKVAVSVHQDLATTLAAFGDHATLATLLRALPPTILAEVLPALDDPAVLAAVALVADPRDRSRILDTSRPYDGAARAEAVRRLVVTLPDLDTAVATQAIDALFSTVH